MHQTIIQSALAIEYGEKPNGARTLSFKVYRNQGGPFSSSDEDVVGIVTLS